MLTRWTRNQRLGLILLAMLAPLQLLAVTVQTEHPSDHRGDTGPDEPVVVAAQVVSPAPPSPWGAATQSTTSPAPATPPPVQMVDEPEAVPAIVPAPAGGETFADRFPAHAAATQDPRDPASTRWALLIGINEHGGGVADNIGSRQDAEDLRHLLLANGWRDDHILLLTDRQATGANIVAGIGWLADNTDEQSLAVFHYSGHSKTWDGRDIDGDGETTDEGLWPSDHAFITDSELVALLDPVRPQAMWLSFATCNAAGLADPGMARPGRILTFSSGEPQKSYEQPAWNNSVWGWLMLDQALGGGHGDLDGDGRVTVEEAFGWARPRATDTTRGQRYGSQDGVMVDDVSGDVDLLVPGAPRPAPTSSPPPDADQAPPPPADRPGQQPPSGSPERTEENNGNRICLLCFR